MYSYTNFEMCVSFILNKCRVHLYLRSATTPFKLHTIPFRSLMPSFTVRSCNVHTITDLKIYPRCYTSPFTLFHSSRILTPCICVSTATAFNFNVKTPSALPYLYPPAKRFGEPQRRSGSYEEKGSAGKRTSIRRLSIP